LVGVSFFAFLLLLVASFIFAALLFFNTGTEAGFVDFAFVDFAFVCLLPAPTPFVFFIGENENAMMNSS
jgi:hypothetical protein